MAMLTPEQKKALGDMLVKRLSTGEDLETATTFVVNYFRKRAHKRRVRLAPKPKPKRARRAAKPRRAARDLAPRTPTPTRTPAKRDARGRWLSSRGA